MDVNEVLKEHPQMQEKLYIRGFLASDEDIDQSKAPFIDKWIFDHAGNVNFYVHPQQHYYRYDSGDMSAIAVGHMYNPFTMQHDETGILSAFLQKLQVSEKDFWEYFNEITGIFTLFILCDLKIWVIGDPTGMQTNFLIEKNHHFYVSSHTMLLGELLNLEKDQYIQRLTHYRFFPLLGNSLPGDRTQFKDLIRMTPNICYEYNEGSLRHFRFFTPYKITEKTNQELAQEAGKILNASLELVTKKWNVPAISMTGGCDSKTTLACANGLYDRFHYFSYCSSEAERVDCDAAAIISDKLHIPHTVYEIPDEVQLEDHYEAVKAILKRNCGDILDSNPNDIRKRIVLDKLKDYDVEVKSWASEIGRAYYSKRFNNRTSFPDKPNGRLCTTLYKFFLHDRKLVRQTDRVFDEFIKEYYEKDAVNPIPWYEQFFWEFRVPSWNGLVITGEHRYTSDIEIPYNNRLLLTLLLSVSLEDRINDSLYYDIRHIWKPEIDESGVSVTNLHHTRTRAVFENIYYSVHSRVPF